MKKIIVFALCIFSLANAFAQREKAIHWITFIDTKDKDVGEIDVKGRQVLYNHFINDVNAVLEQDGYVSYIQDFYDDRVTPENCKAAVELLQVGPEDIIVFYYIGHGGRPNTDAEYMKKHPWPQMCMAQHDESKFIPLEWVDQVLSNKGARLSITIGMCCNSLANISVKTAPNFSPNYGPSFISNNKAEKIRELFIKSKGNVLATSASPIQTSICGTSYLGYFDIYTSALCILFDKYIDSYEEELTWDMFLSGISTLVNESTNGQQTPIHVVSEQKTQKEDRNGNTNTSKPDADLITQLNWYFAVLINSNIDAEKRIGLQSEFKPLFSHDAVVKMIGQDGQQVVDRESVDTFFSRIATSRLLMKVAVVDVQTNSLNKITQIKVLETYKQK